MKKNSVVRAGLILAILASGLFLLFQGSNLTPETPQRQQAVERALAPGRSGGQPASSILPVEDDSTITGASFEVAPPIAVDLTDLPQTAETGMSMQEAWESGLIDIERIDSPFSEAVIDTLLAESAAQPVDPTVQNLGVPTPKSAQSPSVLAEINSFKSIDYNQIAGFVPPDPIIAVGEDRVIAAVNTSFEIYDLAGNSLAGPLTFATLWGANCGSGAGVVFFDPFLEYDEQAQRYIIGITAFDPSINGGNNGWACIAVSQTNQAVGGYWLYSVTGNPFPTEPILFFDYPHLGVGQNGLYLEGNMFSGSTFIRSHVIGLDKASMYAGNALAGNAFMVNGHFTIQPSKIHGFDTGGWPTNPNEPHYYVSAATGNNKNTLTVWQFNDLLGPANSFTQAGTVTVNTYNMPINQTQKDGDVIQANDNRMLDVKYWNGRLYATHTIGCNGGTGTVNCVRWYIIDVSTGNPVLLDQGTATGPGFGRFFPAIAVNMCGDMLLGYSGSSPDHYPGIYVAGREVGDPPGQVKSELTLKAGEITYTAFDGEPYRWGDYSGMAIHPDGKSFWYIGEYSRNQANTRWSNYIGQYQWDGCTEQPTPTPTATSTATPTKTATATPTATTTSTPTATNTNTATPTATATPDPSASATPTATTEPTTTPGDDFELYLPFIKRP